MITYGVKELEADIAAFEGTVVKFNYLSNCALTRLYSEYYTSPLPGSATVADIQERVKQLLVRFDISACDEQPGDKVTVYGVSPEENEVLKLFKHTEVDDPDKIDTIVNAFDFPYKSIAIWMPDSKAFLYLRRKNESDLLDGYC